jgi:VWFA-related protein
MTSSWRFVVAGTLLIAFLSRPFAQAPQQPTFRTEANYVRVDVYATKDGIPVPDLRQDEFELLEGGLPQKIEQFERVVIRAAGPQDTRLEPSTVAESRSMAATSRARLFVLFLDVYHVDVMGSHNIRKPLIDALDRFIGQDDLVAVMTPEMEAADISFARKTTTIEGLLTRYWPWGERDSINLRDPEDQEYGACYPNESSWDKCSDQNGIAAEMIDRRHEQRTLDALQDLVRHLRGVREERKAILAITDGWLLYRENQNLARPLNCLKVIPGPAVGFNPGTGRMVAGASGYSKCEADRLMLAQLDDNPQFREILDEANRANASFYPVDPRGLVVFDTPIVRQDVPGIPEPMVPPSVDQAMLNARLTSLRTLAENTDGLAIVSSNDLAGGLRRVADDLSSYYLLGYYSSGKLDGKFHSISVRIKRPGVQLRARRGYLATTAAAATRASGRGVGAPTATLDAEAAAIQAVLAPLGTYAREVPIRMQAAAGWKSETAAAVWVAAEASPAEWREGADADLMLVSAAGATVSSAHARIEPGSRSFRATLALNPPMPGDYSVRLRVRPSADASSPSSASLAIALAAPRQTSGAMYLRRGTASGNKDVPTADLRFRRSEQITVEVPGLDSAGLTARLLDRAGKPLAIPVSAAGRTDADGTGWATAQASLAPLAPGDYLIELGPASGQNQRVLAAFRVIP